MPANITEKVQEKYGAVAASALSGDTAGVRAVAEAFGYSPDELASIPAEANLGLSCGNPTAFARLRPGEVVVDLGCGAGIDVLLAAPKVGPAGRAIGIDMTPAMIDRARRNAAKQGLKNVEFHLAAIDRLPLANASADCMVSNCVINLAPDKQAVFTEMFRVLKPGGRVAVSDIALKKPLPDELAKSLLAYIGCVAGAISIAEYDRGLRAAGFTTVEIIDTRKDLNAYALLGNQVLCCSPADTAPAALPVIEECCTPAANGGSASEIHGGLAELARRYDINAYAASVQVFALKSE